MKRSKEDTAETRKHVVSVAAREFRENGLQFSLADLMGAAGLTHGGFYRHFDSKEQLVAEACEEAMRTIIESLTSGAKKAGNEGALRKIIERYMSPSHKDNCANGCPIAALGSELARSDESVREKVLTETEQLIETITELLDEKKYPNREVEAKFLFSSMVGAMTMSRMLTDTKEANAFLRAAAERLVSQYC